ncbi:hypothetical protein W03_23870 [Nitrosomonas sp. PY1]|nr:hypothetical protein W03_23870 [Nitrosomonas sp. PY1]
MILSGGNIRAVSFWAVSDGTANMESVHATIERFEVMRMFRKGEIHLIERQFNTYST